ncbi:MAG: Ig-like domain-containing protein [Actinomycetaceae bacterium]|nr:Ig-like domain-containing protein [Actinomycetaceae bacterium]
MRIKKFLAGVVVACIGVTLPTAGFAAVNPNPIPGVDLGKGVTVYKTLFLKQENAKSECLAAIKKWRQDALDQNIQSPTLADPWKQSGKTVRQHLADNGIAESDYLNPKWSRDLEVVSLARAAETQAFGIRGHERANAIENAHISTIQSNGLSAGWESIYYSYWGDCEVAIDQWASEKTDWVNGVTGPDIGHYTWLINPGLKFYGIGGVEGQIASTGEARFPLVWIGNATAASTVPDESGTEFSGNYSMPIIVNASTVDTPTIDTNSVNVGASVSPTVSIPSSHHALRLEGTWSSADPGIASVNMDGSIKGVSAGSTTITLTADGVSYAFPFDVRDKAITEVSAFTGITTESGTAPALPTNASVTYDDNSTGTVPVTWNAIDASKYSAREGGSFTVNGTIAGWSDPVSITVTVNPATVDSVSPTTFTVTTPSGTAPTLPATASVTWSNGDVVDEAITWETIDPASYSSRDGGTFTVNGTVPSSSTTLTTTVTVSAATVDTVATPAEVTTFVGAEPTLPATASVTWSNGDTTDEAVTWASIDPAAYGTAGSFTASGTVVGQTIDVLVNVVEVSITSVTTPAGVTTNSGTAPVLPTTVQVEFNNNTTGTAPVTWDAIDASKYSVRAGGEFTVNGTVTGWADPVSITVTVNPATVDSVSPTTFTVTTPSGTAPVLPATASVTWSNGDTTDETITWEMIDPAAYSSRDGGTFTVNGTVTGSSDTLTTTVTVTPATVDTVATPDEVTTTVEIAPVLPETTLVTWSNGDATSEPITWNSVDPANYASVGSFTASGTVVGQSIDVLVNVVDAFITGVTAPSGVTTESGTAPTLPSTVSVDMSDGTTANVAVTWDEVDAASYSMREGGEFTVNGTVAGWADSVSITVTVNAATPTSVSPSHAAITTESGTRPVLPGETTVTWSNGDTTTETVAWDPIDPVSYSTRGGGTFTVYGSVPGWDDAVSVDVTVNAATVSTVVNPTVTTDVGTAPELPATVSVTWSNGDVTDEPAVWEEIAPEKYAAEGQFTVNGTVSGVDGAVTATVIVAKPTPPSSGEVSTQPGKPGVKPTPAPTTGTSGTIPRTGVDVALISLVSVLLLGAGGALLVARRGALK